MSSRTYTSSESCITGLETRQRRSPPLTESASAALVGLSSQDDDSPTAIMDVNFMIARINDCRASQVEGVDLPKLVRPSGPRKNGEGVEEDPQAILSATITPTQGACLLITILASGFVIGPEGCSIQDIIHLTNAEIRSHTTKAPNGRCCREFIVEGDNTSVAHALHIIYSAVNRYKKLCEGEYKGRFVRRDQHVSGVTFIYQPPPREAVPQAAKLLKQDSNHSSGGGHRRGSGGGSATKVSVNTPNRHQQQVAIEVTTPSPTANKAHSSSSSSSRSSATSRASLGLMLFSPGSQHQHSSQLLVSPPPLPTSAASTSTTMLSPAAPDYHHPGSTTYIKPQQARGKPPIGSSFGSTSAPQHQHPSCTDTNQNGVLLSQMIPSDLLSMLQYQQQGAQNHQHDSIVQSAFLAGVAAAQQSSGQWPSIGDGGVHHKALTYNPNSRGEGTSAYQAGFCSHLPQLGFNQQPNLVPTPPLSTPASSHLRGYRYSHIHYNSNNHNHHHHHHVPPPPLAPYPYADNNTTTTYDQHQATLKVVNAVLHSPVKQLPLSSPPSTPPPSLSPEAHSPPPKLPSTTSYLRETVNHSPPTLKSAFALDSIRFLSRIAGEEEGIDELNNNETKRCLLRQFEFNNTTAEEAVTHNKDYGGDWGEKLLLTDRIFSLTTPLDRFGSGPSSCSVDACSELGAAEFEMNEDFDSNSLRCDSPSSVAPVVRGGVAAAPRKSRFAFAAEASTTRTTTECEEDSWAYL